MHIYRFCTYLFFIDLFALIDKKFVDQKDFTELRKSIGSSIEFVKSLLGNNKLDMKMPELAAETQQLASCAYEDGTKWGEEVIRSIYVQLMKAEKIHFQSQEYNNRIFLLINESNLWQAGFLYASVAEDVFTGVASLHCKGWNSVYFNPSRPQFLGSGTTNLNDFFVQGTRWSSGLVDLAISKYCPLIYGLFKMSFLECVCYGWLATFPIWYFFSLWCLATIPQLCLLNGISLYPEVNFFTRTC